MLFSQSDQIMSNVSITRIFHQTQDEYVYGEKFSRSENCLFVYS